MELSKKTTVLFPPDLHEKLTKLALQQGVSMGELIRNACEQLYGIASKDDRVSAVRELAALSLPVASPRKMKLQSVPRPKEISK
ncbi:type II toxin-antitoxin system HicB family antitoxin [bacterium]|nr:type II toxin-antitoxin system HicB family antitoxin [bacterium]MCI0601505.1 type II toxin-antitoxin system HicB family antitoxin [bacterium]